MLLFEIFINNVKSIHFRITDLKQNMSRKPAQCTYERKETIFPYEHGAYEFAITVQYCYWHFSQT